MSSPPPPLAPLHVLPVAYEEPRQKPAIISLMGVTAIVIASLSMFASATVGIIALGLMIQTKVSKTITAAGPIRYTATASVGTGSKNSGAWQEMKKKADEVKESLAPVYPAGPRGLNDEQRNVVVGELKRSKQMSADQLLRLDQLLAKAGKDIVPFAPSALSVSESGTLSSGASVANYYLIGSGKLEIYDDRGVFFPSDGAPVRVWADEHEDDPASNALPPKRIDELATDAQSQAGGKLTAQQLAALKNELSDPNQSLITPGPRGQRLNVSMQPDGSATVVGQSFIQIDPAGNVMNPMMAAMAAATKVAVRPAASTMTLLDAFLAGALAIYLLVVGILILKQHRRARGMQLVFAFLKIPIAIMAAIGWIWTIEDVNAGAISPGLLSFWMIMFLVIGLAYPIALLFTLRTKAVREYYEHQVA